ncbi:MAG: hypothetical protein JSR62_14435 [Nitrospira sp.]|nr:hypothetical protein [Nitrospira sp.]
MIQKKSVAILLLLLALIPSLSEARCRTVGESASLGSEYGTFPLYPAEAMVAAGQKRDSVALQWAGYGVGVPLFVVAMPFAMVGAVGGAVAHPWTKCEEIHGRRETAAGRASLVGQSTEP